MAGRSSLTPRILSGSGPDAFRWLRGSAKRRKNDEGRPDPDRLSLGDDQEGRRRDGRRAVRDHRQDDQEGGAVLLPRLRHLDDSAAEGAHGPQSADGRGDQDQGVEDGRVQAGERAEERSLGRLQRFTSPGCATSVSGASRFLARPREGKGEGKGKGEREGAASRQAFGLSLRLQRKRIWLAALALF